MRLFIAFTALLFLSCSMGTKDTQESNNCNLENLQVDQGELAPLFSKDVTEYTVMVDSSVESVSIECEPEHDKATISMTPQSPVSLTSSERQVEIVVTAQDNSQKVYSINIQVQAEVSHNLSFNGNAEDAQGQMEPQSVEEGQGITLPVNSFFRPGYQFKGWALTPQGALAYGDEAQIGPVVGDLTLYALWVPVSSISVSLQWETAGDSSLTGVTEINKGAILEITAPADCQSYQWYLDGALLAGQTGPALSLDTGESAMDLSLGRHEIALLSTVQDGRELSGSIYIFITDYAYLTLQGNGGTDSEGSGSVRQSFLKNGTADLMACPFTREGYVFIGWSLTDEGATQYADGGAYTIGNQNVSLMARWLPASNAPAGDFQYSLQGNEILLSRYMGSDTVVEVPTLLPVDGLYYPVTTMSPFGGFPNNDMITQVVLPQGLTNISRYAFYMCESLTQVTLPQSITEIGQSAFEGCVLLDNVELPDNLTSLGISAFSGCSALSSISLPSTLSSLPDECFAFCISLESIEIPASITSLGDYTFMGCSLLDNFNIPATLLTLGEGAFVNCTALTSIDVDPAHPNFSSVDGILFNQSKTNLISYPLGKSATYYEVPSTVTRVDTGAFAGNSLLQSIGLPLGLISIGEGAFSNCSALQSIDLPESLEIIESHAYLSCTALASVTLPSSIREIGEMAFLFCDSMTSITVNAAVPPTLGASVFMPILAEEVIYVPSASLAAYQADADWSVYSAIIQSQP